MNIDNNIRRFRAHLRYFPFDRAKRILQNRLHERAALHIDHADFAFRGFEHDRATVGLHITRDHIDESCLAGAIGADQADFLAGRYIESQGVGCNHSAETLVEPAHGEHRVHSATPFSVQPWPQSRPRDLPPNL